MNLYLAGTSSRPYVFENIGGGRMNIYLAGGITGNLLPEWKRLSQQIGGGQDNDINIYIAGNHPLKQARQAVEATKGVKILESFYYCRSNDWIPKLLPYLGDFLLDSGAFSFRQASAKVDWNEYTEAYIEWINRYKIEKFFEMDIDGIISLREVEVLRRKIEVGTGRQPIPVWHANRGQEYFERMCQEYPYVAIATTPFGIEGRTWRKNPGALIRFINTAHRAGAKIHGLGYTSLDGLKKYHFDSVDSTAWLYGNRGGYLYVFDPKTGTMGKRMAPAGHRLKSTEAAKWNFNEWVKFQKYAEKYL